MPKIPSIPRISIVVPVGSSIRSFEDTLVSVLENRPAGCEILVAHDGNYDDPFNLDGEVRFVKHHSAATIDLITAGIAAASGQFVHVLTPGFQAIEDWTEPALDLFSRSDVAVVAPAIHQTDVRGIGPLVAAGWRDTQARMCQAINREKTVNGLVDGAYLQASFWRRDLLRSLGHAFQGQSVRESSYAYGHLATNAGWKCLSADKSIVTTGMSVLDWDASSFGRGRQLRAIRSAITGSDTKFSLLSNLVRTIAQPGKIGETLGQACYRGKLASTKRRLQIDEVATYQESSIVTMPQRQSGPVTVRRAA